MHVRLVIIFCFSAIAKLVFNLKLSSETWEHYETHTLEKFRGIIVVKTLWVSDIK